MTRNQTDNDLKDESPQVPSNDDETIIQDGSEPTETVEQPGISPEEIGELHRRIIEISSDLNAAESHISILAQTVGVGHRENRIDTVHRETELELDQFITQLEEAISTLENVHAEATQLQTKLEQSGGEDTPRTDFDADKAGDESNSDDVAPDSESVLSDDYLVKNT
jgi:hypothetical protein